MNPMNYPDTKDVWVVHTCIYISYKKEGKSKKRGNSGEKD